MTYLLALLFQNECPDVSVPVLLFALASFIAGCATALSLIRCSFQIGYRDHLDKHFFATTPDPGCIFCREERGLRAPRVQP